MQGKIKMASNLGTGYRYDSPEAKALRNKDNDSPSSPVDSGSSGNSGSSGSSNSGSSTPNPSGELNYGYGRTREGNEYHYYDSSGNEVPASQALASGGRPSTGNNVGTTSPYTGNVISEYIDLDKGTSTKTPAPKSYVDASGVVRVEGQTGYNAQSYVYAQVSSNLSKTNLPSLSGLSPNEAALLSQYKSAEQKIAQGQALTDVESRAYLNPSKPAAKLTPDQATAVAKYNQEVMQLQTMETYLPEDNLTAPVQPQLGNRTIIIGDTTRQTTPDELRQQGGQLILGQAQSFVTNTKDYVKTGWQNLLIDSDVVDKPTGKLQTSLPMATFAVGTKLSNYVVGWGLETTASFGRGVWKLQPIQQIINLVQGKPMQPSINDKDVQTATIVTGAAVLGVTAPVAAPVIFNTLGGVAVVQAGLNPSRENVGNAFLMNLGTVAKVMPKFKTQELAFAGETGAGKSTLYGVEFPGGKAVVLGSRTEIADIRPGVPGKITSTNIGARDSTFVLKNLKEGSEIRIASPTETKFIQQGFRDTLPADVVSTERAEQYIPLAQSIIRKTQNVKSKFIQEQLPTKTERLTEGGVQVALDVTQKYGGYVSGSYSRGAQLAKEYTINGEKYTLMKEPRDIDIHLSQKPEQIKVIVEETLVELKKKGYDARIKSEGGTVANAIEVKQPDGKWEKAIEFLGEGTLPVAEQVPDQVLGFVKEGKKITIGKNKATALNEELRGVIQGTARARKIDGKLDIYPPEKRVKDIGSVSVSARTLEMSKYKPGLKKDIEAFEKLYPEELVREQLKKVEAEGTEKVILYDYRPNKPSTGRSTYGIVSPSTTVSTYQSPSNLSPFNSPAISPSAVSPNISQISVSSGSPTPSPSTSPFSSPSTTSSPSQSPISPSQLSSPSLFSSPSPTTSPSTRSSPSTRGSPRSPSGFSPPSKSPPEIPKKKLLLASRKKEQLKNKSFLVAIRRKGKFNLLQQAFGSKEEAFAFGGTAVGQTAAATFKIQETNRAPTASFKGRVKSEDFYTKIERGEKLFIQKAQKRISSPGEKREITYKGILASKGRRKAKRIFG